MLLGQKLFELLDIQSSTACAENFGYKMVNYFLENLLRTNIFFGKGFVLGGQILDLGLKLDDEWLVFAKALWHHL